MAPPSPAAPPPRALLSLLLLLAACAAPPAAAAAKKPAYMGFETPAEAELFRQVTAALAYAGDVLVDNRTSLPDAVMAAAAPPNVTPAQVTGMVGMVLASVALDEQARRTLGVPEYFQYAGRHALYRFPSGISKTKIRGICVFIHGCKHDPESWFYKSDKCPKCTGLPEEVAHTKQCLARQYAVLALASKNRQQLGEQSRCFSSSSDPEKDDRAEARQAIRDWTRQHGLVGNNKKPIYMFGISAGASFAIKFPSRELMIQGVISEVNMPWEREWFATNGRGVLRDPGVWPPVAYYYMENDNRTKQQIQEAMVIFKKNGVPSQALYSPPWKVTDTFFSDRSVFITPAQSASILKVLKTVRIPAVDRKGQFIRGPNGQISIFNLLWGNGYVRIDPRFNTGWTKKLADALSWINKDSPYYNLISDESQIWQSLNVAYSQHEIVGEYVRPTLVWLEGRGKANLTDLAAAYSISGRLSCLTEWKEGLTEWKTGGGCKKRAPSPPPPRPPRPPSPRPPRPPSPRPPRPPPPRRLSPPPPRRSSPPPPRRTRPPPPRPTRLPPRAKV